MLKTKIFLLNLSSFDGTQPYSNQRNREAISTSMRHRIIIIRRAIFLLRTSVDERFSSEADVQLQQFQSSNKQHLRGYVHHDFLSKYVRIFHVFVFSCYLPYNLPFSSRLSKNHPNIWTFVQLIKLEHVRLECILIQLAAGASAPKPLAKTKPFQNRFATPNTTFLNRQINAKELLAGLSLLIGKKKTRCATQLLPSILSF